MTAERDQGVAVPPHVLAMLPEVAGLVLDDWAVERGWDGLHDEFRKLTVAPLVAAMERAARSDPAALAPLAEMPPDVLRRHVRAWAEPGLLRALDEAAAGLVVIA